jgi:hypothetical protein
MMMLVLVLVLMLVLMLAVSWRPAFVLVDDFFLHNDVFYYLRLLAAGLSCDSGTGAPANSTADNRSLTAAHG